MELALLCYADVSGSSGFKLQDQMEIPMVAFSDVEVASVHFNIHP
jgi:hypothetical protein